MSNPLPGRAQPDPFKGTKRAMVPLAQVVEEAKATQETTGLPADDIRHRMVVLYEEFKPTLLQYHEYAQHAAALAEAYHAARFKEQFPSAVHEELTLACSLDARETPASLDKKLAELKDVVIRKVIFDRARATYHLFV